MPRHGPHTTPHMTNKHRLDLFREGKCPYCNAICITKESKVANYRPKKQEVMVYKCGVCGAEAKEGVK